MYRLFLSFAVALAACGGIAAEAPLTVKLGVSRDQALSQLRTHKFCFRQDGPPQRVETYPRCERAGTEWGEAWVKATYDGSTLVELKRYERYTDDARAIERWNQLITDRQRVSPQAVDATNNLREIGLLEAGTRSVRAFRIDPTTIVAIYLLTPGGPEQASILEAILTAPR
jgi:hypothetical protein